MRASSRDVLSRARALASSEPLIAAVAALTVMLAITIVAGGQDFFGRQLWLDEYHTLLMSTRGSFLASLGDLAQGSDFNPPTLFVLTRLALAVTPGSDAVALRLVAFASVAAALAATYLLLRRRWSPVPAASGALAVWSHQLVIDHAFDARFYGPWLAFSALFILALVRLRERPSRGRGAALAVAAVALCTIHYFGVFVWGLVVVSDALTQRRRGGAHYLAAWPALAGPLALAACLPLYLGQKAALTAGATWIYPVSVPASVYLLYALFWWKPVVGLCGLAALSWVVGRLAGARWVERLGGVGGARSDGAADLATTALVSLALLPLVLIAFSVAVQSVVIPRYSLPALLVLGPLAAALTAATIRPLRYLILGLLVMASVTTAQRLALRAMTFSLRVARVAADVRRHAAPGETVLVEHRHFLYPLVQDGRLRDLDLRMLQLPDSARLSGYETVERDVARVHNRLYGFPRIQSVAALGDAPRVLVVDGAEGYWRDITPLYPGYRARRLTSRVLELTPLKAADRAARVAGAPPRRAEQGGR